MHVLAALLLLSSSIPGQPSGASKAPEEFSSKDIAVAADNLGSEFVAIRERAMELLWRAGPAAKSALEAAARSTNRDAAESAKRVLDKFRFGIFVDTPPETVKRIQAYRNGNDSEKNDALRELSRKQLGNVILTILRAEPDQRVKRELTAAFSRDIRRGIEDCLIREDFDAAEESLEFAASIDKDASLQRDYAAFLLLRGKLDAAIVRLKAEGKFRDDSNITRLLARLLQVQGHRDEARTIAESTGDQGLKAGLYFCLEDWRALAKPEFSLGDEGVEHLGLAAALHRLAGNKEQFESAIASLRALAARDPDSSWMCVEALMFNDRWPEAIELLSKTDSHSAFELLCSQMRFAEAFQLAGVGDPRSAARWFAQHASTLEPMSQAATEHYSAGIGVARTLHALGETEEATRLLSELAKFPSDDRGVRAAYLFDTEYRLGLREIAMKHAVQVLANDKQSSWVMNTLFDEHARFASIWWKVLCHAAPDEDRTTTLRTLQSMFQPKTPMGALPLDIEKLAERAEQLSVDREPEERRRQHEAIAEVCSIHGQRKLARSYFEKQAIISQIVDATREVTMYNRLQVAPLLRIGDLHVEEHAWLKAAEAYGRAWQLDKRNPLPLYLQGHSLVRAGHEEDGRRQMALALVLPLSDTARRQHLAEAMDQRGLEKEALRQWELILRIGAFDGWEGDDWNTQEAVKAVANQVMRKHKLRAASLWQHFLFYLLKSNATLLESGNYSHVIHLQHKLRALGLLEAGRIDDSIREVELAIAARPTDVDLVEQAMPKLIAADRATAAKSLFDATYQTYETVCRDFPRSARHHNDLAWLAARCRQRLEDALGHAQEAHKLAPDNLAYLDTLAEVYFQRGEKDKAIELEKQAADREPDNTHFQNQLRRFQKGE